MALNSGVGLQMLSTSRTSSGIGIHRSVLTSCIMRDIGKIGARSSGLAGCLVAGCSGGGGGSSRSATTLYHCRGISLGLSKNCLSFMSLSPFIQTSKSAQGSILQSKIIGTFIQPHQLLMLSYIFLEVNNFELTASL